ncbi:MAG: response regulator transcription factor [Acidimicrobiales bacterium]
MGRPGGAVSGERILVVEDDADIWRSLEILLRRAGYEPSWAADGRDGLQRFASDRPHLVILDLSLPELNGWAVLERIRTVSQVPVMVLTARDLERDKVRGLLGGADDYLTKPFGNDELVARVGAILRRAPAREDEATAYDDGGLRIEFGTREVRVDGRPVDLTPTELRLLTALVRNAGQVLSPSQLLAKGWNDASGNSPGRVKFAVLGLRRKLGWDDLDTCPIETVRGFGYRYRPPR